MKTNKEWLSFYEGVLAEFKAQPEKRFLCHASVEFLITWREQNEEIRSHAKLCFGQSGILPGGVLVDTINREDRIHFLEWAVKHFTELVNQTQQSHD